MWRGETKITAKISDYGISETIYIADPSSLWKHPRLDCSARGLCTSTEWLAVVKFDMTNKICQPSKVILAWKSFSCSPTGFLFPTAEIKDVNGAGREST